MEDFIKYLTENFGESVEKLAKTSEDNPLFDFDLQMINLDKMAKQLRCCPLFKFDLDFGLILM